VAGCVEDAGRVGVGVRWGGGEGGEVGRAVSMQGVVTPNIVRPTRIGGLEDDVGGEEELVGWHCVWAWD